MIKSRKDLIHEICDAWNRAAERLDLEGMKHVARITKKLAQGQVVDVPVLERLREE